MEIILTLILGLTPIAGFLIGKGVSKLVKEEMTENTPYLKITGIVFLGLVLGEVIQQNQLFGAILLVLTSSILLFKPKYSERILIGILILATIYSTEIGFNLGFINSLILGSIENKNTKNIR